VEFNSAVTKHLDYFVLKDMSERVTRRCDDTVDKKRTNFSESLAPAKEYTDCFVSCHLAPAITDFVLDENRKCCNNKLDWGVFMNC